MEEPGPLADHLQALAGEGFTAFKIGWGPFGRRGSHRADEAIVAAAREAVGPDALLMVDAGASDGFWPNGYKWALRTADMLAAYDVDWFEEALPPDALEDYAQLRRRARVPIAAGEVLTRRQSFLPWLAGGALDIVQPDVTKVGGLSEQRRIAWTAHDHGVAFVGHGWNTAVGLAGRPAARQRAAGDRAGRVQDRLAVHRRPRRRRLPARRRRHARRPRAPGLGIQLDPDAVARHSDRPVALVR